MSIIPLGGLGEIGKNMTAIQCGNDILVVDSGLAFPEEDMLGIDVVIPDISFLEENREKVRGIVLTHGHEDHVGALPYVLKKLGVPVYGTRLALGLVREKLEEHKVKLHGSSRPYEPGDRIRIGCMEVQPFRVNHSIPDSVGLAIRTPIGIIVHTGDFKFDFTPVDGEVADIGTLADLGREGVLLLMSDSTGSTRPGFTGSEKQVGETLHEVIGSAPARVVIATFASNVHRIQQVLNSAHAHGRKVALAGRSIERTGEVALELGYLRDPGDTLVSLDEIKRLPLEQCVLLTTGSQGEPMSALSRMASGDHRQLEILPGDTVVIAATPIPGNEKMVYRTINNLYRQGAQVVYDLQSGVHVSGHASQEELKMMLNLVKPRFFMPVHGEIRHLIQHAELAREMGIPDEHIVYGENGDVFELTQESFRIAGKVPAGIVLVDGLGVGDVGNIVLRDRKQLAEDGILIVVLALNKDEGKVMAGPDIVSRGFVYVRESEELLEEARSRITEALNGSNHHTLNDWGTVKALVRDAIAQHLYEKTRRRPMILPIVLEV